MKLILVRHGQTNYNVKDLCNSRPNPKIKLTALGKKQIALTAQKLKAKKIDVVYVSELIRSQQSARIINKFHHAPTIVDKRLNERGMGSYEDKPVSLFYEWRNKHKNPWTCAPRGGESYEQLKKRVASFFKDLMKEDYKTVLIVTHLTVLKTARGFFKNLDNVTMDRLNEKDLPNGKILNFNVPKQVLKRRLRRINKKA